MARLIASIGVDGAALLRLWREKRGEVEPEDLSGKFTSELLSEANFYVGAGECGLNFTFQPCICPAILTASM
jgi:hypothetical protein